MYAKKGLPEKDELVVCTIKEADPSSVFVSLDEFENIGGMIHVSEIARKQVRAMKVYLKPGTKLVCKVMLLDSAKRYVELSLRRVGEGQRRTKLQQWNNEKIANDILEVFAKQAGLTAKAAYDKVGNIILDTYGVLYPVFVELAQKDSAVLQKLDIEPKLMEQLTALVQKRITPPKAEIIGIMAISSNAENGVEIIKTALENAKSTANKAGVKFSVKYISAPKYQFKLEAKDNKTVEDGDKKMKAELEKYMASHQGSANFS